MKIVVISDTHGKHRELDNILPNGDMIIHCGDLSNKGLHYEVQEFCDWFANLDYKYKIMIPGNHDFFLENFQWEETTDYLKSIIQTDKITLLIDKMIEIEGYKIYGTPWTPIFFNWAFMENDLELEKQFDKIPKNLDILITHGPQKGILDIDSYGHHEGCEILANKIKEVKPKYHLFGHFHASNGIYETENTIHINASVLNERYKLVYKPITFTI